MIRGDLPVIIKRKEEKTVKRGEIVWEDKIIITRDKKAKKIEVNVSGLWNGKDRRMISRTLLREMRRAASTIIKEHKKADLKNSQEEQKKVELKQKRLDSLEKARAAKKEKKLEEEKNNVRGQRKSKSE